MKNLDRFPDWEKIRKELILSKPGATKKVHKYAHLPNYFTKTTLGFYEEANEQYRDNREKDSLHIRVYDDYMEVHLDKVNPEYDSPGHLVSDFGEIVKSRTVQNLLMLCIIILLVYVVANSIKTQHIS